ncbi:MAG: glycosyltransferase family 39 protein [Burkholderiaceae bacterium]|nr:glycosyltransferase family 39 protein [Burkholderiaceae bacterium]
MRNLYQSKTFFLVLLAFGLLWFYALGARTLVPTDEGRYAEMAREMLSSGDWITTRLNAIKYFEKPPLQVWFTALTFKLFGLGEWQARLWTGLCGLLGIFLAAYTGHRLFGPWVGITSGLVLASSFYWAAFGHINTLDMGLSGTMSLALFGLLLGQNPQARDAEQRNWMLVCWAGMALAVLSKGLIGIVLPGAVLVLYTLASRDWAIWTRLHLGKGLLLFFAIAAPWFVLVSLKNPEFAHFFFIHEHFERFTSKVHNRFQPWHYFIPLLVLGILPWLTVLLQSVLGGMRKTAGAFQPQMVLTIWAVFIFFFFSISDSKLPSYILPIFPALAVLIALHLERAGVNTWRSIAVVAALIGVAGQVVALRLPGFAHDPFETGNYAAAQPWVYAGCTLLLAGGLLVLWLSRRAQEDFRSQAALILAAAGFVSSQLFMLGTEQEGRYRAGMEVVEPILAELTPATPLYAVGVYEQSLPFYLRHTMTLVEHADEMEFGLGLEPQLWLPTREAFVARWNNGQKALAITRPEIYADLLQSGLTMHVVAQNSRRVVIANDPKP